MFDLNRMIFFDADSGSGSTQEKDVNIDEMDGDQIDSMGKDDLDRVEFDEESGDATLRKDSKKEPEKKDEDPDKKSQIPAEGDDKDKKPEDETGKEPEKKPEPTVDEQIDELEKIPKEERTDAQKLELRRLNAERRMHQATREAAEYRKQNEDLKKQLFEYKSKDMPEFEELTEDEYNDLPDDEKAEYDKEKQEYITATKSAAMESAKNTFTNFVAAYKAITGEKADIKDLVILETLPDGTQRLKSEALRNFLASDDFRKLDEELSTYRKGYDGTYSVEQIMKANYVVNKDKILADAQLAGRQQAMNDIKNATNSDASSFDTVPKESGTRPMKKLSELTDEQIENMSKEQYENYVKEMEREGMA